jgi:hypothetical protein
VYFLHDAARVTGSYPKTLRIDAELAKTLGATPEAIIPAKAGIQQTRGIRFVVHWIPAFAGMTV